MLEAERGKAKTTRKRGLGGRGCQANPKPRRPRSLKRYRQLYDHTHNPSSDCVHTSTVQLPAIVVSFLFYALIHRPSALTLPSVEGVRTQSLTAEFKGWATAILIPSQAPPHARTRPTLSDAPMMQMRLALTVSKRPRARAAAAQQQGLGR